jgi:hypothetical protein
MLESNRASLDYARTLGTRIIFLCHPRIFPHPELGRRPKSKDARRICSESLDENAIP